MLSELLVILALVLTNGVLAGAEIALVTVRPTRIEQLVEEGSRSATYVARLRDEPERLLATVQIGITVVAATAGAFGGATVAEDLAPVLASLGLPADLADEVSFVLVVGLVSYLSLVLGELVPKSLALRAAEPYALVVARPLWWMSSLARPVVWILTQSSNAVLRAFGDETSFSESRISPEELQQMVAEAGEAGTLHPKVEEIATRALAFGQVSTAEVMVPRSEVVALAAGASLEEARRLLSEQGHARVPVFGDGIDDVVGTLVGRDLLRQDAEEARNVGELARAAVFVPGSMRAVDALQELQSRQAVLAVVVDEHGGTEGIVTSEDLLEELVGEILSEDEVEPPAIEPCDDGSFLVAGRTPLREVSRAASVALPENPEFTTIAGLCISLAGRIPAAGEQLETPDGVTLEVMESGRRRIRRVRLRPPPEQARSLSPPEP